MTPIEVSSVSSDQNIPQLDGIYPNLQQPFHLQNLQHQQPLQCDTCYKIFESLDDLEKHDAMHQFCCDQCNICYTTQVDADLHELQVHPDESYARDFIPMSTKLLFAKQKVTNK